ncbi:hypothetical protein [Conexibacter sp. SYSU D00693]|uniref:hypothetical protein n=1 Tax=Conexibacter sp. SYSU D00693 TaxID=2812560 RepID=UPI00196B3B87|nr:hypothetical protein [Conexibacter sp. SYSU D00693]
MSATYEAFAVRRATDGLPDPRPVQGTTFTREEILDAIRRWAELHGGPPASDDWDPARARRQGKPWRAELFHAGTWPSVRMVRRQFATFGAALEAAGFPATRTGKGKPRLAGRDEVLRAIREWLRRYGEPPTQADWDPVRARSRGQEWRIERYRAGDWPSLATARSHFGSLGAAVRAAGLEPGARWESLEDRAARHERNLRALADHDAAQAGPTGPTVLAQGLREVAAARAARDDEALRAGLLELASSALRWAGEVRWTPDEER